MIFKKKKILASVPSQEILKWLDLKDSPVQTDRQNSIAWDLYNHFCPSRLACGLLRPSLKGHHMDSDKTLIDFWLFEEYLLSLRRYWNYIQPIPALMVMLATALWTKEQIKTLQQKQELSPENTGITWFCVKVLKVFKIILLCPVFLCKQVNALGRWNDSDSKNWRSSPITQVQCSDSTIDRENQHPNTCNIKSPIL